MTEIILGCIVGALISIASNLNEIKNELKEMNNNGNNTEI